MKKHLFIALFTLGVAAPALAEEAPAAPAAEAATAASSITIARNENIVTTDGVRVGRVYSVGVDGSPRVIADGRFVIIPLATLSRSGDRLVTSLTRRQVQAL